MNSSLTEEMESMTRYERRELSHNWEDIRPLLKDTAQITYEIIRPVLLCRLNCQEHSRSQLWCLR